MNEVYPGLIKRHYPNLRGHDWIRQLTPDDRAALIAIGLEHAEHGHLGGIARAKSAARDCKGRFCATEPDNTVSN